jgi:hypothetical protein
LKSGSHGRSKGTLVILGMEILKLMYSIRYMENAVIFPYTTCPSFGNHRRMGSPPEDTFLIFFIAEPSNGSFENQISLIGASSRATGKYPGVHTEFLNTIVLSAMCSSPFVWSLSLHAHLALVILTSVCYTRRCKYVRCFTAFSKDFSIRLLNNVGIFPDLDCSSTSFVFSGVWPKPFV